VPLSSARQNKESEKGLFNTNYEKLKNDEQKESPKHTHSSILRTFSSLN
jgi:hypothetical protein